MTSTVLDIGQLRVRATDPAAAPGTVRPASQTLILAGGYEQLPAASELPALLSRVPIGEVRIAEPVDLSGTDDRLAVREIGLIRECASIGARVGWSLVLTPQQLELIRQLDHLPAPERMMLPSQASVPMGEWRAAGNFGRFYFRKGPSFHSVVEQRPESSRRLVVDDPAQLEVLHRGLDGCAWTDLTDTDRHAAAAAHLAGTGLLLRLGEHCVTLPVHMRTWPIGAKLLTGTLASAGPKLAEETSDPVG